VLFISESEIKV